MEEIWERLSPSARRVLVLAQEEGRFFKHSHVGTEHLLLALTRFLEDRNPALLSLLGWNYKDFQRHVIETLGTGSELREQYPAPRLLSVLSSALADAEQRSSKVDVLGMIISLLKEREGMGAGVLYTVGFIDARLDVLVNQLRSSRP